MCAIVWGGTANGLVLQQRRWVGKHVVNGAVGGRVMHRVTIIHHSCRSKISLLSRLTGLTAGSPGPCAVVKRWGEAQVNVK